MYVSPDCQKQDREMESCNPRAMLRMQGIVGERKSKTPK